MVILRSLLALILLLIGGIAMTAAATPPPTELVLGVPTEPFSLSLQDQQMISWQIPLPSDRIPGEFYCTSSTEIFGDVELDISLTNDPYTYCKTYNESCAVSVMEDIKDNVRSIATTNNATVELWIYAEETHDVTLFCDMEAYPVIPFDEPLSVDSEEETMLFVLQSEELEANSGRLVCSATDSLGDYVDLRIATLETPPPNSFDWQELCITYNVWAPKDACVVEIPDWSSTLLLTVNGTTAGDNITVLCESTNLLLDGTSTDELDLEGYSDITWNIALNNTEPMLLECSVAYSNATQKLGEDVFLSLVHDDWSSLLVDSRCPDYDNVNATHKYCQWDALEHNASVDVRLRNNNGDPVSGLVVACEATPYQYLQLNTMSDPISITAGDSPLFFLPLNNNMTTTTTSINCTMHGKDLAGANIDAFFYDDDSYEYCCGFASQNSKRWFTAQNVSSSYLGLEILTFEKDGGLDNVTIQCIGDDEESAAAVSRGG